jgi:hypothetical protein
MISIKIPDIKFYRSLLLKHLYLLRRQCFARALYVTGSSLVDVAIKVVLFCENGINNHEINLFSSNDCLSRILI